MSLARGQNSPFSVQSVGGHYNCCTTVQLWIIINNTRSVRYNSMAQAGLPPATLFYTPDFMRAIKQSMNNESLYLPAENYDAFQSMGILKRYHRGCRAGASNRRKLLKMSGIKHLNRNHGRMITDEDNVVLDNASEIQFHIPTRITLHSNVRRINRKILDNLTVCTELDSRLKVNNQARTEIGHKILLINATSLAKNWRDRSTTIGYYISGCRSGPGLWNLV